MRGVRTFEYSDPLNDDFAATKSLRAKPVTAEFPYVHRGVLWWLVSFVVYRLVVTPLVMLYCRVRYGLRIRGRRELWKLKTGYFLYGNHTQYEADAFIPSLLTFPRKCYIVTGAQAVSIRGIRTLVQMLGGIPLPTTARGAKPFYDALQHRIVQKSAVAIYPEAHIWPYYTDIRPFPDGSFTYPVRCGVPAVPYAVTYRRRRIFRKAKPLITVQLGKPLFPDMTLAPCEARQKLRDEAYRFMKQTADAAEQPAYYRYIRVAK